MQADESPLSGEPLTLRHYELQRRMAALDGFYAELEKTRALAQDSARILKVARRALQMYEANFGGAEVERAAPGRPALVLRSRADRVRSD